MRAFTDTIGHTWEITVPISGAKRVKLLTGVDLYDVSTGSLFSQLDNPITLVDVLYVLCKPQADERKVDDVTFGSRVPPAALEEITDAIVTESAAMLYPAARREAVLVLWAKIREARERMGQTLLKHIGKIDSPQVVDEDAELLPGTLTIRCGGCRAVYTSPALNLSEKCPVCGLTPPLRNAPAE